jgi:hypothetical protein
VVDEEEYYEGGGGNPLHYARPLDIAAARGLELTPHAKVLDFGYGAVGQLRLLASLGVDATGVDVKPELPLIYGRPGDAGPIPGIEAGPAGSVRILNGFFPRDAPVRESVGADYDFVIAKNTLKKGYIHPDRPAPERYLIHLGVDDATFLATFHSILKPRGWMMLYNIFEPIPDDKPFKPMSDGRSPFSKEQWEAAGFSVEAFDVDDSEMTRRVLSITDGDEPVAHLRALYTLLRRRD